MSSMKATGPRLLFVSTVASTLRAFILPFAQHFRALGCRVDALAQGVESCEESNLAFDSVHEIRWTRDPLDPLNLTRAPRRVREVVEAGGYDLVHVHTPVASFVTRFALRDLRKRAGLKVVYTAHGFHFHPGGGRLKNYLFKTLEQMAGRWTDYLITINRVDEAAAKAYGLVPDGAVRYAPGIGVDVEAYRRRAAYEIYSGTIRRALGLSESDQLFLMVAELIPRKRQSDAIEALARLKRADAHLAFAGEGPLFDELKALAEARGVEGRVHFLGFRRDVPALVATAAATLLPSAQEGLPRSVMESLCLEVPVIGSDIRGVRELLDGGCGLLTQVGDVEGIAHAMRQILEDPEEARAMGARGRVLMDSYDIRRVISFHEQLYAEALGAKGVNVRALAPAATAA